MTLMYAYEYNTEHKFISYLSYIDPHLLPCSAITLT